MRVEPDPCEPEVGREVNRFSRRPIGQPHRHYVSGANNTPPLNIVLRFPAFLPSKDTPPERTGRRRYEHWVAPMATEIIQQPQKDWVHLVQPRPELAFTVIFELHLLLAPEEGNHKQSHA